MKMVIKELINWDNPVVYFFIGIVLISITVIASSKILTKEKQVIYSVDIHDDDSVVIYKNHYSNTK
jgi:hypothetical protein